ncbi:hypothetical protein FBZ83_118116 [Azospirillum brasilense]|uniref:Uncharacterized protein n=1 Tax=Azospirillum brasilense TaxID=192 RepID=A0A560BVD1_AZOBR|nr:hypothetical protein [Azospirillum brasilense]TWA76577.1 hypothetical protein FBZ83_118116 [Azospirillum brasilense]
MPNPKNFSAMNAAGERYGLDPHRAGHVLVYRFADKAKATDWRSRRRNTVGGGFAKPSDPVLNDWALKQSSFGSQSENSNDNPFVSVATDYETLYARAEGWVKKILETAPDLGVFSVPYDKLYRPSPTKPLSKEETEWLYYDGDVELMTCLQSWLANPYKK